MNKEINETEECQIGSKYIGISGYNNHDFKIMAKDNHLTIFKNHKI